MENFKDISVIRTEGRARFRFDLTGGSLKTEDHAGVYPLAKAPKKVRTVVLRGLQSISRDTMSSGTRVKPDQITLEDYSSAMEQLLDDLQNIRSGLSAETSNAQISGGKSSKNANSKLRRNARLNKEREEQIGTLKSEMLACIVARVSRWSCSWIESREDLHKIIDGEVVDWKGMEDYLRFRKGIESYKTMTSSVDKLLLKRYGAILAHFEEPVSTEADTEAQPGQGNIPSAKDDESKGDVQPNEPMSETDEGRNKGKGRLESTIGFTK